MPNTTPSRVHIDKVQSAGWQQPTALTAHMCVRVRVRVYAVLLSVRTAWVGSVVAYGWHEFAEAHDIMCANVRHSVQCNDFVVAQPAASFSYSDQQNARSALASLWASDATVINSGCN